MTTPLASVSGLASGVQWQDMIEQIMAAERARTVDRLKSQVTLDRQRRDAWTKLQGLVETLNAAARRLRTGTFDAATVTAGTSPVTGRALVSATAAPGTAPGAHTVEVLQLASAERVAGAVVSSPDTALGVGGTLSLNGVTVTLDPADTLAGVRDRVNAAKAGVSASVVSTGPGAYRLVLTADTAGAAGIDFGDDASGALCALGFLDTRSKPLALSSVTASIATALGIPLPPPATIMVGGVAVRVDPTTDSLAAIAARIRAAGGSAHTVSEPHGEGTAYRLVVDGMVTGADADGEALVAALGLAAGERGAVPQTVITGALTDDGGNAATAATALVGLRTDGAPAGLAVGDVINVRGTRGDGSVVTVGITVRDGDTVQSLLDRLNAADAFGGGARPAVATLGEDGRIQLTDSVSGESRLSLSLGLVRADGTTAALAPVSTAVTGRARELAAGADAQLRVDGLLVTRASNTVADAIPGVTLELQQAEPGATVTVTVAADHEGAIAAVKELADAYNAIRDFLDQQQGTGKPLDASSTLRSVVRTFTAALRTEVTGADGQPLQAAAIGVALDDKGRLKVDEKVLGAALAARGADIAKLFGFDGVAGALVDATDDATRSVTGSIAVQLASLDRSLTALNRRVQDGETRLETRRAALVQQFTRMEEALGRLQAQGSYLASQLAALRPPSN